MKRVCMIVVHMALVACVILATPLASWPITRCYDQGDRLAAQQLFATDGTEKIVTFEAPSVVVLWATWSPGSMTALSEILDAAPKGGIRWQITPINVDAPHLSTSDTSRVNAAAREAGWSGPVWYDRGYDVMDTWGVIAVPTIVFTALGGTIDEIEHDWSERLKTRLFTIYFGAFTDSFPGMSLPVATAPCRAKAETARTLWRLGKVPSAITVMQSLVDSCAGLPNDIARYVDWKWQTGDSTRQRTTLLDVLESHDIGASTLTTKASIAARGSDDTTAIALCWMALAIDSAFYPAWILLAERSFARGDSAMAATAYMRANELNRVDSRALALGARMAEARGDLKESQLLFRAAYEARLRRSDK